MLWSSDVRCLYCDGRLPLYRKITNGQFCSAPHRKLYWQEQERLGVERLHQTHDSLRAFRLPEMLQPSILGKPEEIAPPPPSGIIAPSFAPTPYGWRSLVSEDFCATELHPQTPLWAPQIASHPEADAPAPLAELIWVFGPPQAQWMADRIEAAELNPLPCTLLEAHPQTPRWAPRIANHQEVEAPAPLAELIWVFGPPQAQWMADRIETAEPNPLLCNLAARIPLSPAASSARDMAAAGITKIPVEPQRSQFSCRAEPVQSVMLPCRDIALSVSPQGGLLAEQDDVPRAENLMMLAMFAAQDSQKAQREPWAAPFTNLKRAYIPLGTIECGITLARAMPMLAGLRPLSIDQVPLVHGTWIDNLRAMGSEAESPRYELSTPALRPRLRLAAGSRYPVATRDTVSTVTAVAAMEPENLQPTGKEVTIPERKDMPAAAASGNKTDGNSREAGDGGIVFGCLARSRLSRRLRRWRRPSIRRSRWRRNWSVPRRSSSRLTRSRSRISWPPRSR